MDNIKQALDWLFEGKKIVASDETRTVVLEYAYNTIFNQKGEEALKEILSFDNWKIKNPTQKHYCKSESGFYECEDSPNTDLNCFAFREIKIGPKSNMCSVPFCPYCGEKAVTGA